MRNEKDSRPRFEYYPPDSPLPRTVHVERTPFIIGRAESADLQINATSVSREHAQLIRTSSGYRIEDLGSTNGTEVNGKAIGEKVLLDGDSVTIADVELTFACTAIGRLQRIVTQPLKSKRAPINRPGLDDATLSMRALNESLLWQTIPLRWEYLNENGAFVGRVAFVSVDDPLSSQLSLFDLSQFDSVVAHLQSSAWQIAIAQAAEDQSLDGILLRVEIPSTMDEQFPAQLALVLDSLPPACRGGALFNWSLFSESALSHRLFAELLAGGMTFAIDGFAGGDQCIAALKSAPPDYIVLDPTFARGVLSHPRRGQQLNIVQSACDKHGIAIVLPAGLPDEAYDTCHRLGIAQRLECRKSSEQALDSRPLVALP